MAIVSGSDRLLIYSPYCASAHSNKALIWNNTLNIVSNPVFLFLIFSLEKLHSAERTGYTGGLLAGFLNIGFLIERDPLCFHIRHENSTSRANKGSRWLSCSDRLFWGYRDTGPIKRVVRGEIHEWEVYRENIFSVDEIIIRNLSYEGRKSKLLKSTNWETYMTIAEEEK